MKKLKFAWANVCWTLIGGVSLALLVFLTIRVASAGLVLDDYFSRWFFIPLTLLLWGLWFLLYTMIKRLRNR